ncbi:LysR family transcriptional regulator [Aggregatilinea lenta]|uniref:LysR family transcriptional regulator n=1 Tax=Aggregatilinea lenta TaxID=913108 RepID=UPI000E5A717D|nr:LysR family transcriptional regulator [Aggregatilinea lenta]
MLELHELQVFLTAAETENFSEAGRILQISQPAVSAQIQTLENRLHTQLFDRAGRNIHLNEVGEALVPMVRNLLREAQRLEESITAYQGQLVGHLTIGCSTAAGKYVLPKIMARFRNHYPSVNMTCYVGAREHALERLCAGQVDLAVSSLRVPRSGVEYQHFSDDLLVLIAPLDHPWAKAASLCPEDLLAHPMVLRESGSGTCITLNRELAAFDMSIEMFQPCLTLWNTEAIVQAVVEGVAPGFVSYTAAEWALHAGLVAEVPVTGLRPVQRLYMARNTSFRTTEAQEAFWDFTFASENELLRQHIL